MLENRGRGRPTPSAVAAPKPVDLPSLKKQNLGDASLTAVASGNVWGTSPTNASPLSQPPNGNVWNKSEKPSLGAWATDKQFVSYCRGLTIPRTESQLASAKEIAVLRHIDTTWIDEEEMDFSQVPVFEDEAEARQMETLLRARRDKSELEHKAQEEKKKTGAERVERKEERKDDRREVTNPWNRRSSVEKSYTPQSSTFPSLVDKQRPLSEPMEPQEGDFELARKRRDEMDRLAREQQRRPEQQWKKEEVPAVRAAPNADDYGRPESQTKRSLWQPPDAQTKERPSEPRRRNSKDDKAKPRNLDEKRTQPSPVLSQSSHSNPHKSHGPAATSFDSFMSSLKSQMEKIKHDAHPKKMERTESTMSKDERLELLPHPPHDGSVSISTDVTLEQLEQRMQNLNADDKGNDVRPWAVKRSALEARPARKVSPPLPTARKATPPLPVARQASPPPPIQRKASPILEEAQTLEKIEPQPIASIESDDRMVPIPNEPPLPPSVGSQYLPAGMQQMQMGSSVGTVNLGGQPVHLVPLYDQSGKAVAYSAFPVAQPVYQRPMMNYRPYFPQARPQMAPIGPPSMQLYPMDQTQLQQLNLRPLSPAAQQAAAQAAGIPLSQLQSGQPPQIGSFGYPGRGRGWS